MLLLEYLRQTLVECYLLWHPFHSVHHRRVLHFSCREYKQQCPGVPVTYTSVTRTVLTLASTSLARGRIGIGFFRVSDALPEQSRQPVRLEDVFVLDRVQVEVGRPIRTMDRHTRDPYSMHRLSMTYG